MTKKEFEKLQELILMFKKGFRSMCRNNGRTCEDCSFSAGYEGCTLSQCSESICEIRGFNKDGTTIRVGDFKLTTEGEAKVNEFIEQAKFEKKELTKSGIKVEHSIIDESKNVIIKDLEVQLKYESGEIVNFSYEITDGIEITLELKRKVDFYKVV